LAEKGKKKKNHEAFTGGNRCIAKRACVRGCPITTCFHASTRGRLQSRAKTGVVPVNKVLREGVGVGFNRIIRGVFWNRAGRCGKKNVPRGEGKP